MSRNTRNRSHFKCAVIGMVLVAVFSTPALAAQKPARRLPAFPGAEGFGAYTPGGRGGRIIEVTNLNTKGPGSLQWACNQKGPRIVVFRVSGVINGTVYFKEPFITIAGQTAPGDGICIRNGMLIVGAHDVIVRHLRARPGDNLFGAAPTDRDCIKLNGRIRNVIIDHCSASWGVDENVQVYGPHTNVTVQWCITSESLRESIHPKGPHGMGMLLGCASEARISVHHNLLAHNMGRNPLIAARRKGAPTYDFRNNVIYKHRVASYAEIAGHPKVNFVGNTYRRGVEPVKRYRVCYGIHPWNVNDQYGPIAIYVRDNAWAGYPNGAKDPWEILAPVGYGTERLPKVRGFERLSAPNPAAPVTTEPRAQAFENVLAYAGCTRPVRDVVDARIVAEVRAGTGRIIDSQEDVGGWPAYAGATPPADSDHDAMPDAWEKRYGFNPKDPTDGPKDRDGDGYTNVEEFLNQTDPTKLDTGAPIPQGPVKVQAGNDRIRGEAARKIGRERMALLEKPNATPESADALAKRAQASGKEVADVLGIKFARIPKGTLKVGSMTVTLTKPYELSVYEITESQWEAVMGTRPWSGKQGAKDNPKHPATFVSYLDCQEFIRRLNACGSRKYRLPTHCEWLYAARAGTDFALGFDPRKDILEHAWCSARVPAKGFFTSPQAVGLFKPNPWGLYDMGGNAAEWVHDWRANRWYNAKRQGRTTRTDPMGPKKGTHRLQCGGNFRWQPRQILAYPQSKRQPYYRGVGMGFRLARNIP